MRAADTCHIGSPSFGWFGGLALREASGRGSGRSLPG
jgi:hypothetical protein